jgi:amino acid adenylation domain-containing protein
MTKDIEGYRISPQQSHVFLRQRGVAGPLLAQCVIHLDGIVDLSALQEAIAKVVSRHGILRTRFVRPAGIKLPLQVISDEARLDWRVVDSTASPLTRSNGDLPAPNDLERLSRALLEQEREIFFDLADGAMLHVAALPLTAKSCLLALSVPTLCSDTLTLHNLFREIGKAYVGGGHENGDAEPVQYLQFSEWQNEVLSDDNAAIGKEYWQQREMGGTHNLMLPFAAIRRDVDGSEAEVELRSTAKPKRIRVSLNARVTELAQQLQSSEEIVLLCCWQVLLWQLSGESAVTTTHVQNGRKYDELAGALGLFARSLPLVSALNEGMTLATLAREVSERVAEGGQWQEYFVPDESGDSSDSARGIGYEYERRPEPLEGRDVRFDIVVQEVEGEGEAVKLRCVRSGEELWATLDYDPTAYGSGWMQIVAEQMQEIVESAIVKGGQASIAELNMLSQTQRQLLLVELNRTKKEYPSRKSIHQLIEEQVERTPEQIAVVSGDQQLSYSELNARANQLGRHLRSLGVGPEVFVAVYMDRSLDMVVALLAVLKAGGAYVPLDTMYPYERLSFMIADARVPVLVTQESMMARLPEHQAKVIYVDSEWSTVAAGSTANLVHNVSADNAAYVIYTSGSTGTPKGVMVPHKGLVNYLNWCTETYKVAEGRGAPVHSPLGFDLTITSIFSPLLAGKSLFIIPEDDGIDGLTSALRSGKNFSLLKVTPSHLEVLNQMLTGDELRGSVKALIIGGEALSSETVAFWRDHSPETRIVNEYGPTETVVGCCVYEIPQGATEPGPVPIGRPIANTNIYLLDKKLRPVAVGVSAELYIGGEGLARGYLGQPEMTAERFIPHPFSEHGGERVYRTGDMARYRADGEIEYLGRVDHQVKLRGFRVELGEIEAVLRQHPKIGEVVVMVREEVLGDKRIVAYVVSPEIEELSISDIRRFLRDKLPEHMMPASLVSLSSLPLTPNGKVDREALPAPGLGRAGMEEEYVAPRTVLEEAVARIWAETIGIELLGVHDNFFELGGHSLLATQVISRVRDEFEVELPVRIMFEGMTVAEMAAVILSRELEPGQSEKIARMMNTVEGMTDGEFVQLLELKRESNENQRSS